MIRLVSGAVRIGNLETVYGQNVTRFETTSGILNIVRHDLMRYGAAATDLIVVDPDHMELRYLGDSMSRFQTDVGLKSNDSTQDEWLTEAGLQVAVPESLAKLSNIVSAA